MSKKKAKKQKKSYGEQILARVGKSWVSTSKIIKGIGCPARAARRVLRGLVKSRQLKSVKVQRERYFAAPGTKAAPPKVEAAAKGNAKRSRSRKAAKSAKKSGGKSKRSRKGRTPAASVKSQKRPAKKRPAAASAKRTVKRARKPSGPAGTPKSNSASTPATPKQPENPIEPKPQVASAHAGVDTALLG